MCKTRRLEKPATSTLWFDSNARACTVNYIEPDDFGGFYLDDVAYEVSIDSVEQHFKVDDSSAESLVPSYRPVGLVPVANDASQGCRFEKLGALEASCSDDGSSDDDDFSESDGSPTPARNAHFKKT